MAQKSEVSCGNGIVRLHCAPFFQNTLQKLLSQWFCQQPMSLRHIPMRVGQTQHKLTNKKASIGAPSAALSHREALWLDGAETWRPESGGQNGGPLHCVTHYG